MKKIWIILLIMLSFTGLKADGLLKHFEKTYGDNDEFTIVRITPKMFKMISTMLPAKTNNDEMMNQIMNLKSLHIYKVAKNKDIYFKEAKSIVDHPDNEYEELMNVQDKGEKVIIYTKEKEGIILELIMLVQNKDECVIIGIEGIIDLKLISNLSGVVNVNELEHLKIDNNKNDKK